jgi:hypothetical protein
MKKFYMVLTLRLCVLYGSQYRQRLLPYTSLAYWLCITEVESVYSAVRTECLYKTDAFNLQMFNADVKEMYLLPTEFSWRIVVFRG